MELITNRNISLISKRTWWWWREIQLENGSSSDQSRPTSRFYQCELIEKVFCQKLTTTLRDFNHIQGKTTKTWLANVKRIFQGNNYLVLIGWNVKVRKLLPKQKYKNKPYISLSHAIRQTLNPPFLREKWLNLWKHNLNQWFCHPKNGRF